MRLRFLGMRQATDLPLQPTDRLKVLDDALDDMRSSRQLADSIARSGVDGIELAPPAAQPR